MIKVDKNIPMPVSRRNSKYPWDEMEVGDSFFILGKTAGMLGGLFHTAKRRKQKYTVRTVTENGVNGCRVWRIK